MYIIHFSDNTITEIQKGEFYMKKLLLLCLSTAILLTSCGGKNNETRDSESDNITQESQTESDNGTMSSDRTNDNSGMR